MAEITLLESLSHWSQEKCRESIEEVLPKLILYLETETNLKCRVDAVHILYSSVLPCLPLDQAEELLFSKVMPKAAVIFDEILAPLNENFLDSGSTLEEARLNALQLAHQVLSELMVCLEYLNGITGLLLQHMYSIPNSIIHVLESSYVHCKDSDVIYGEMLELISDSLSSFFKRASDLQMAFSIVLDQMNICSSNENDVKTLTDTCNGMSHLCQIISLLDVKISAALWKTYMKLITQHHSTLFDKLDVSETLLYLCGELEGAILQLYSLIQPGTEQEVNQKEFTRVVKICNFNLKLIVTLCGRFCCYLGNCVKQIVCTMLMLFRLSFATLQSESFTQQQSKEIQCSIVIGIEPLVIHLLPDEQFLNCVIESENMGFSSDLEFDLCLLKIMVLQTIPAADDKIQDLWNAKQNPSLVTSLLYSVEKCYVEIYQPAYFPGEMYTDQAQRIVSFYEYVCYHLFSYVSTLPAHHFENMEKQIFGTLSGQSISAQLSSDLLCFLARFGSASLCFSHCCLLAHVVTTHTTSSTCAHLNTLLYRLVKFLNPCQKVAFIRKFPPKMNLSLWKTLPVPVFFDDKDIMEDLIASLTSSIEKKLVCLSSLKSFYTLCDEINLLSQLIMPQTTNPALLQTSIDILLKLWAKLPITLSFSTAFLYMSKELLHFALQLVPFSDDIHLLKIVQFNQEMWKIEDDLIKVMLFNFIKQWSFKKINFSTEQQEIITNFTELLGSSMSNNTLVLQQHALRVFAKFAYMTPHEDIVAECCKNKHNLKESIKNFLCKIPIIGHLTTQEIKSLLSHQKLELSSSKELCSSEVNNHSEELSPPPLKKLCTETVHNEVQSIIRQIASNVQQLEDLWSQCHSEELTEEIHVLSSRMLKLI